MSDEIAARLDANVGEFMEKGPGLRWSTSTWICAVDETPLWIVTNHKFSGEGGFYGIYASEAEAVTAAAGGSDREIRAQRGWALKSGLGAMGVGTMWTFLSDYDLDDPTYADAPRVKTVGSTFADRVIVEGDVAAAHARTAYGRMR